jgi:hypothetical protein
MRLGLQLVRRGHGRFLGADVLEQHTAVIEILLGQAVAGGSGRRRGVDRRSHQRGVVLTDAPMRVMKCDPPRVVVVMGWQQSNRRRKVRAGRVAASGNIRPPDIADSSVPPFLPSLESQIEPAAIDRRIPGYGILDPIWTSHLSRRSRNRAELEDMFSGFRHLRLTTSRLPDATAPGDRWDGGRRHFWGQSAVLPNGSTRAR